LLSNTICNVLNFLFCLNITKIQQLLRIFSRKLYYMLEFQFTTEWDLGFVLHRLPRIYYFKIPSSSVHSYSLMLALRCCYRARLSIKNFVILSGLYRMCHTKMTTLNLQCSQQRQDILDNVI